jgi:hypothetical protein
MESGASRGHDVNERPRRTIILLRVGLVLSAITVLLGVGSLVLGFLTLAGNNCYADYMEAYGEIFLALVLLVLGIIGRRVCMRRIRGRANTDLAADPAGLCPKCGSQVASTDQNCPTCHINLAGAREHLDELGG